MRRKDILTAAEKCVCTDRQTQYGSPENSFKRIASFWNTYLGDMAVPIKPRDVAAMLADKEFLFHKYHPPELCIILAVTVS